MHAQPLAPPPNPYGAPAPALVALPVPSGAIISGASGTFAIRPGSEVHVGRDPQKCPVTLAEPRVSAVHATLKFENGQLFARDENSNNGTHVAGVRLAAGVWSSVPAGSELKFGPAIFTVRLDV